MTDVPRRTQPALPPAAVPGVIVRAIERRDLPQTARLQIQHLGAGLFPRLGQSFVRRWHETFIGTHVACGFVAVDTDQTVVAFVLATTDQHRYVAHTVRAHRWPLVTRGAAALLLRPRLLATFLRTRSGAYLRRLRHPATPAQGGSRTSEPVGVIHAIVTAPAGRGQGLARRLLAYVEDRAVASGTHVIDLVTDDGPAGAAPFYRALGWIEGQSRTNKDGRAVTCFTRRVMS